MMSSPDAAAPDSRLTADRIELAATILMAIAAILTAWAAFQSTKWSGVQADSYSQAGAARTESTRATTIASRQVIIDVLVFLDWFEAYHFDYAAGEVDPEQPYVAEPDTLSGMIATRFRPEFQAAFEVWAASAPLSNPDSAGTPFDLPEYALAAEAESQRLASLAEERTAEAQDANQRGDNYVLLTVMFAIALFFAGVSGKLDGVRNSALAFGISVVVVAAAAILMATYPVEM